MNNPGSGREFLDKLKRENADRKPSFGDFSEYLDIKARLQGVPLHGMFELTPLCNFSCKMCYVHLTGEQLGGKKVLSPEQS